MRESPGTRFRRAADAEEDDPATGTRTRGAVRTAHGRPGADRGRRREERTERERAGH